MATLEQRLIDLATAIGADIKTLTIGQGTLTGLSTTAKNSLVAAINEMHTALQSVQAGAVINDAGGNGDLVDTWSASKIFNTIEAAKTAVKNDLTAGAGAALDTLNELAIALGNDPQFATTIATQMATRLRFDAAQVLTAPQQVQACANLGIGGPDTNFVTSYTTAKA